MRKLLIVLISLVFTSFTTDVNVCDEYESKIIKVYDGDTVTAEMDLGFDITLTESIRLANIDAPEIRGDERPYGLIARDALRELIDGKTVTIINHGRGKYGRVIGEIILNDTLNVNDWLVENGFAVRY